MSNILDHLTKNTEAVDSQKLGFKAKHIFQFSKAKMAGKSDDI